MTKSRPAKQALLEDIPKKVLESIDAEGIDQDDRAEMAALCGTLLELQNSWNFAQGNTQENLGPCKFLEQCFAGEANSPFYARHKHPEGEALERIYARMHQCNYALATVSGEAAISLMIQALTKTGDHILVSEKLFGTSKNNFKLSATQDGREVTFVSLHDFEQWQSLLTRFQPKMVFVESPSNPLAELADIEKLRDLIKETRTLLVVDSTYAPATIYQPLVLGADLVIESATKFIDGQTRVTGGLLATKNKSHWEALFKVRNAKGYNQVSFNALSLTYNARSLSERVLKQSKTALLVAKALSEHPKVEQVHYLGLDNDPQHQLAARVLSGGFGSMISFRVKGGLSETQSIADATGFLVRANLGSIHTIITHPITSTHSKARLSEDEIISAGVTPNLLRLSVGLEPAEVIIHRLSQALDLL